jgi:putative Mg2+ transporter-C (MgtC) family protein
MLSLEDILVRLLLGAVIGGIIGFERQAHGRPAGFRTQLLVCVASVLLMLLSEYYYRLSAAYPAPFRIDPTRIAAGAITGVGFLGAGVVIKTRGSVHGLTTAACIWMVSAIGLAIGAGLYLPGVIAFLITLFALFVLRIAEQKMPDIFYRTVIVSTDGTSTEDELNVILEKHGARVVNTDYEADTNTGETTFTITISFGRKMNVRTLLDEISFLTSAKKVSIKS